MTLVETLQNIGLSDKEARVYLALLELKEALPSTVARWAAIKRPTAYVVLQDLQQRGLVSHVRRGKATYYSALHPNALLNVEQRKFSDFKQTIPELVALHEQYATVPQLSVYEGHDGLIQVMEDTLTAKTELYCWANITLAVSSLKDYYPTYIAKKVKRGLWVRGIVSADAMAQRFQERAAEELREVYLIPKERFPFKNEINIYDDKVAIISHDDQMGVIIQNQNIADTQRSIFMFAFEYAKLLARGPHAGENGV